MAITKIIAAAKEEISDLLSRVALPVFISKMAFSTRFWARSKIGFSEDNVSILNWSSSICFEACFRKGYLAKSSEDNADSNSNLRSYSVSILGAKKKVNFPSFVCWKSILTGMSDENSRVAMSEVAEAAFIISER